MKNLPYIEGTNNHYDSDELDLLYENDYAQDGMTFLSIKYNKNETLHTFRILPKIIGNLISYVTFDHFCSYRS